MQTALAFNEDYWAILGGGLCLIALLLFGAPYLFKRLLDEIRLNRRTEALTGRIDPEEVADLIAAKQDNSVNDAILKVLPSLTTTKHHLRQAGIRIDIKLYITVLLLTSCVIAFFFDNPAIPSSLNWAEPIVTLVAMHSAIELWLLRFLVARRRSLILSQLSSAISHVSRSLQVGQSPDRAIAHAVRSSEAPLAIELANVVRMQEIGIPLDLSLRQAAVDIDLPEFDFFVSAIEAQMRSGGNLVQVLEDLVAVIRARFQLQAKVAAMTAEGRVSGIVLSLLPAALLGYLSYADPSYVAPLYDTETGNMILGLGFVLITVGMVVMLRMAKLRI